MIDEFKLCTKCNMKYNGENCDNCNPKDKELTPKVRTSHHRNKEEAARLADIDSKIGMKELAIKIRKLKK